jgi:hypothetical protein
MMHRYNEEEIQAVVEVMRKGAWRELQGTPWRLNIGQENLDYMADRASDTISMLKA